MDRLHRSLMTGVLSAALIGCAGPGSVGPSIASPPAMTPNSATPETATTSPAESVAVVSPKPVCPTAITGEPDPDKIVSSRANIFNAGHSSPRAPGGGGTGNLPPMWPLPPGESRVVTITDAAGCVTPVVNMFPYNGPAGDMKGPTNINAHDGISGIVNRGNGMFVVGVFLTDEEPENPAPPTLDFTDGEDFESIEPEIGQVFFVGDGEGKRFVAAPEATRVFLGFADAALYTGDPGWYGNNAGQVQLTVTITIE